MKGLSRDNLLLDGASRKLLTLPALRMIAVMRRVLRLWPGKSEAVLRPVGIVAGIMVGFAMFLGDFLESRLGGITGQGRAAP